MLPTVPQGFPLRDQHPSRASPVARIRFSMLATAMVDALGAPVEFHHRFTFDPVKTMLPNDNFNLGPGVWTDDTSMMLCLARSIARSKGAKDGFDEKSQLQAYLAWHLSGELSAIGRCFDIGNTISQALNIFRVHQDRPIDEILQLMKDGLSDDWSSGNGSLMRVLPIGLAYWRDETRARMYARRSSCTTHPSPMCVEACEVWTTVIIKIMQATEAGRHYSKLGVLEEFALYPYSNSQMRQTLAVQSPESVVLLSEELKEDYYWSHHPLLLKITRTSHSGTEIPGLPYLMPSVKEVPSTGFVLHSLAAALYCFMGTRTFEEGALMAVNMGDDADTVGAIYAGLAGVWYANDGLSGVWSGRVVTWRDMLLERELVEQVADELVTFAEGLKEIL